MSSIKVRAALEVALSAMTPPLATAFENASFTPVAGTPYQRATVLFARPDNSETSRNYIERGFMQVDLAYPIAAGSAAANTRAEALRSTFARGQSFINGGVTTLITDTAEIAPGAIDGDRFTIPVRIYFQASVTAS